MNLSRFPTFVLTLVLTLFLFPAFCAANLSYPIEPQSIVINEIAWAGTRIEGVEAKLWWQYEWIELYNKTGEKVNISGWKIENAKANKGTLEIPSATIEPAGYFLICKKEVANCDLITWSFSLNDNYQNNGQLILKDFQGNLVDQTPQPGGSNWPGGDKETKQTMERRPAIAPGTDLAAWQTSSQPGGTPKIANSVVSTAKENEKQSQREQPLTETTEAETAIEKRGYPAHIFINEFLPSARGPDEKEEWIEIFNANDAWVDLSGWQIKDVSGKTNTYTLAEKTLLPGQGFLLLKREETKITLNNDGDGLTLVQPDGTAIETIRYEAAPLGESYNRFIDKSGRPFWAWSSLITPGAANQEENAPGPEKPLPSGENEQASPSQEEAAAIAGQLDISWLKSALFPIMVALLISFASAILIVILKRRLENNERELF